MAAKITVTQHTLWGDARRLSRYAYAPGEFARLRAQTKIVACAQCGAPMPERKSFQFEVYYPYRDDPVYHVPYCRSCAEETAYPQNTFWCQGCDRCVDLDNGARSHERVVHGEIVCTRCYVDHLLDDGLTVEQILSENDLAEDFVEGEPERRGWRRYRLVLRDAAPLALAEARLSHRVILGNDSYSTPHLWIKDDDTGLTPLEREKLEAFVSFEALRA